VGAESLSRLDPVLVDDPKRSKAQVLWVVIRAERERVIAFQPSKSGAPSLVSLPDSNHR
jgi:hypothetical protein